MVFVVILLLAVGLGLMFSRVDFPSGSVQRQPEKLAAKMAMTDDDFRSIPLAEPPGDAFRPPPVHASMAEPESEAMRQLASRMSRESADLQVVTHPDGRRSVDLRGRFLHMSAAVTGADGKTKVHCFSSPQEMADSKQTEKPQVPAHVR